MVSSSPSARLSKDPIYKRVTDILRERILRGDYPLGSPAPSEWTLRQEFQISSTTARRCLNDLEGEGLVYRRQGKGTFVCERRAEHLLRAVGLFYHDPTSLTTTLCNDVLRGIFGQMESGQSYPELLNSRLPSLSGDVASATAEMLRHRQIRGVVILSPTPEEYFREILAQGIPVVSAAMEYDSEKIYGVVAELSLGMAGLKSELIAYGHRSLLILRPVYPDTNRGILSSAPPPLQQSADFACHYETLGYADDERLRELLSRYLRMEEAPTVILCYGYELALQVRHLLQAAGCRVPDDISIVFFGVSAGHSIFHQLKVPGYLIGKEAIMTLFTLMSGHVPLQKVTRIPVKLVQGETLGPASKLPFRML